MWGTRTLALVLVSAGIALAQEPGSLDDIFRQDGADEPLASSSASLAYQYIVAHFPFGGGWSTQVMLGNGGSKTATVNVTFFNQTGASASVPLAGKGLESSQQLSISSNDVQVVSADTTKRNSESQEEMWATVGSSQPLDAFSLFDLASKPPAFNGAVGTPVVAAAKTFRFPVSINGPNDNNAELAIANPNNSTANVTIMVLNSSGSTKGTFQESLQANNQIFFSLSTKMNFGSSQFSGSVAVCASEPVGLAVIGVEGTGTTAYYNTAITNDPCP